MTYNLKLTNGSTLVTIADGVSDTTYTSLTLFGKNFAGYGPLLNENQVHLLENFSNISPPSNPLQGQLWWNSQTRQMHVRTLQEWKIIGSPTPANTAPPVNNVAGDQWWDTTKQQLNIFNGTTWSLVGPAYTSNQGVSGPVVADVYGEYDNQWHTVTKFLVNDVVVAILSNDPTFSTTDVTGFNVLRPGFTLSSIAAYQYYGDADNALHLGGVAAANYLRGDVASTTHFPLSIQNNLGLNVGTFNDLNIAVQGNEIAFLNNIVGRDISFYIKDALDQQSLALRVEGSTGRVHITHDPVVDSNIANKHYVDVTLATTEATLLRANGTTPIIGNLSPQTSGLYSLGGASTRFDTVYSTTADTTTLIADHATVNTILIDDAPTLAKSGANKTYVDGKITTLSNQVDGNLTSALSGLVDNAPTDLSTLGKLAASINDDPALWTTITNALALTAPKASPDFTGTPQVPTATVGDISSKIANTSFVHTKVTDAITVALSIPPVSTSNAIQAAIDNFAATPIVTGQIIAPLGVQITGGSISTTTVDSLDIGSATNWFRNVYARTFKGTAVQANYADLAEMYVADSQYDAGTVLDFGGSQEVTMASTWSAQVAGVVSTRPAYLMNTECPGEFVVALALQGRCPVKVIGPVSKGDMLVSAGGGFAESKMKPEVGTVIGKALQDFNGDTGIIEVAVGRC